MQSMNGATNSIKIKKGSENMEIFKHLSFYDRKRKSVFVSKKKREIYNALYTMKCIEIENVFGWWFLHGFLLGRLYK